MSRNATILGIVGPNGHICDENEGWGPVQVAMSLPHPNLKGWYFSLKGAPEGVQQVGSGVKSWWIEATRGFLVLAYQKGVIRMNEILGSHPTL